MFLSRSTRFKIPDFLKNGKSDTKIFKFQFKVARPSIVGGTRCHHFSIQFTLLQPKNCIAVNFSLIRTYDTPKRLKIQRRFQICCPFMHFRFFHVSIHTCAWSKKHSVSLPLGHRRWRRPISSSFFCRWPNCSLATSFVTTRQQQTESHVSRWRRFLKSHGRHKAASWRLEWSKRDWICSFWHESKDWSPRDWPSAKSSFPQFENEKGETEEKHQKSRKRQHPKWLPSNYCIDYSCLWFKLWRRQNLLLKLIFKPSYCYKRKPCVCSGFKNIRSAASRSPSQCYAAS